MAIQLQINPVPKPRMTRADSWKKRPVVLRYWAYKDELNLLCDSKGVEISDILGVSFVIPMPKSWSKPKKLLMNGKPHQQKPDLDNLIKAVKDCLLEEDSHVWKYDPPPYKVWGEVGQVIFYNQKK